jgi:hypothetical protein
MSRNFLVPLLTLALMLFGFEASSASREGARASFLAAHPGARFVEDGVAGRYYIVYGFASAPVGSDVIGAARSFALDHGALLGLAEGASGLVLDRVVPHRAERFVRFDQTLCGLPVFGARVIVHVDANGRIVKVSSKAIPGDPRGASPAISADEAAIAAGEGVRAQGAPSRVTLGYLPVSGSPVLAYRVVAPAAGMHVWASFVDALTGGLLLRYDLLRTLEANVFLESPTVDKNQTTVVDLEGIVTEGEHAVHTYGDLARTASCTSIDASAICLSWAHNAVAGADDGFLGVVPDMTPHAMSDGFSEVMSYYHVNDQNRFMRDEFGYDGTYTDPETGAQGAYLWMFVNADFANAQYVGGSQWGSSDMIVFGQSQVDFAYDADVIVHEFTHSVSAKAFSVQMAVLDGLGVDLTGMGVEEGNADYFAVSRHGNPVLGEYTLGKGSSRNANNDNSCPNSLLGESHNDGQIVSGAMWDVRQLVGQRRADHLEYTTLASNTVTSMRDYADALAVQASFQVFDTSDLHLTEEESQGVLDILDARGLTGCERVIPLVQNGQKVPQVHVCLYAVAANGTPSSVQYEVETGANTEVLALHVDPQADTDYDVLVRKGAPVAFTWGGSGGNPSWTAQYDYEWKNEGTPVKIAKLSNLTEVKLEKNAKYYWSIICRPKTYGCQSYVTVSMTNEPEVPEPDAGIPDDTDEDASADGGDGGPGGGSGDGCGCAAAGPGRPGLVGALLGSLFE